ncbi:NFX1-type zinc finger-containing protein 1-like [Uloborus diversus]|uniref:NFX1-type zinc finger-containing protein 1-like n=1 Tax=Uloborus diversus TaxID=327109 RepID=UPI002409CDC1|nr:NFX1-type zinc finger-containing protein 1-like [Uloborus diversus]XP_054720304.1 NFX1-type zinc finger-containing protein 1-like [Uloborus diversus]
MENFSAAWNQIDDETEVRFRAINLSEGHASSSKNFRKQTDASSDVPQGVKPKIAQDNVTKRSGNQKHNKTRNKQFAKTPVCESSKKVKDRNLNFQPNKKSNNDFRMNKQQNSSSKAAQHAGIESNNHNENLKREVRPMGFRKICELVNKDPNEIVLTILSNTNGFDLLLEKTDITNDLMARILILIGKACASKMRDNVSAMINKISSKTTFIFMTLQLYLAWLQRCPKIEEHNIDSLKFLVEFLGTFQQSHPSTASECLIILLPIILLTCNACMKNNEKLLHTIVQRINFIKDQNEHFLKKYTIEEIKRLSRKEALQMQSPPENYRLLPTLPNKDDIHQKCRFLRPNIIEGKYQDVEHYLDVQYRLLREDYVKPLRDGITKYLMLKQLQKSFKSSGDVRIYNDVHIIKQEFAGDGVLHVACFDATKFSKIRWEYSKRFLTGSLLCMSSDDFKTMLFASVARRDAENLKKGLLLLRFEELTDEVLNLSPLRSFVVVETDAYFEAYRYNLNALHELNSNNLPMQRYIINAERTVLKPEYLDRDTTYDMRPLFLPLNQQLRNGMLLEKEPQMSYKFTSNLSNMKSIPVMNDSAWPSKEDLDLDSSQYNALKNAVTKEFAVIQGPPGTGKTFIGLRIVQLLLHNIDKWQDQEKKSPILVVCYTNHALDQFLEGVLFFTEKIVRIGGRGRSEHMAKYQLNNLKKHAKETGNVLRYLKSGVWEKYNELNCLKERIHDINRSVDKSLTCVLSESELGGLIPEHHYQSLKSYSRHLEDDGCLIYDWLGVRGSSAGAILYSNFFEKFEKAGIKNEADNDENFEDEEELECTDADIEFIEAERNIDTEDIPDISVNFDEKEETKYATPELEYGWQIQGGKKQFAKYISNSLKNSIALKETEADNIKDIWTLEIQHRWQLYKFWLERYIEAKRTESLELQQIIRKEFKALSEIRVEEDLHLLKDAHVIGMTTTGAAKYRGIVQRLNPRIIIVEEAAEILESHIVTSLAEGTQHVILIGDHQQLRPSPTVHMLAVKYDLNVSLFERMVNNHMECFQLSSQHRMRPEIAALLVPHIYSSLENHPSVNTYESIKGVNKNLYFIMHNYNELQEFDSKSKVNEYEATFIVKLCKYLLLQGYDPSQITVLTTYSGQLFAIKKLSSKGLLKNVHVTVVDNFQGEENDIILISFVRSNEEGAIGFLSISNRVCVALSRAKKGLYCIGNFELLAEKSKLWQNIVSVLQEKQSIGSSLQLTCQNHPTVSTIVSHEKDFDAVPEGGCTRNCEFRLMCGHTCSLMCHPYDSAHETVRCLKSCPKTCNVGHKCRKKCYEKCGPCKEKVSVQIPFCGHLMEVECHLSNEVLKCTNPCQKYLNCGHRCLNKCSDACIVKCTEMVKVKSEVCGHVVEIRCCNSKCVEELVSKCEEPCRQNLSCGHMCAGKCNVCYQGRLHVACKQRCQRILICGHECKSPCSKSCPPCKKKCDNRCVHSKCPKKCGEPCETCTELCAWSCKHYTCKHLCGELCNRDSCNAPCEKLLKCNHPCIGYCGEPCPNDCRICDEKKVKTIFFGFEDEEDARYIVLEDCGHYFESEGLSHWMTDKEDNYEIQMKFCPTCKTVIRKNLRFGDVVKKCLADIEKVKRVTYGDKNKNIQLQKTLLNNTDPEVFQICQPLKKVLLSGKSRSIQEITVMENVIKIITKLIDITHDGSLPFCMKTIDEIKCCRPLINYVNETKKWLLCFIGVEYLNASDQQLEDLNWEVYRLAFIKTFLKFIRERCKTSAMLANPHVNNIVQCLLKYKAFRKTDEKMFLSEMDKLCNSWGTAVLNVSEVEKKSILKAMGLSLGHWYQCPNGHVYCITECGGAMEEGKCYECNEKIGGRNHRLLDTNRVAREMDGATQSSWPGTMNLEDYRF